MTNFHGNEAKKIRLKKLSNICYKKQQQQKCFWTNHENYGHSGTYSIALSQWFKMGGPKSSDVISQTQAPEDVSKEE